MHIAICTYLGTQGPCGQHMATVVESFRLHLGVTGSAEIGVGLKLRCTLEDLHVMHQGLIALSNNSFILQRNRPP